ncbi:hypothetical protein BDW68DRAFT_18516 [Aspergillus falconensis]
MILFLFLHPWIFTVSTALDRSLRHNPRTQNLPSLCRSPSSRSSPRQKKKPSSPTGQIFFSANPGLLQSVGVSGFVFFSVPFYPPTDRLPLPAMQSQYSHSSGKVGIYGAAVQDGVPRQPFLPFALATISIRSGDHYFLLSFAPW